MRVYVVAACALLLPSCPARAEDSTSQPQFSWREMWAGADATKDVWLLYTGVTLAPLSKDIYTDGLRLRMTSGYGRYTAQGGTASQLNCNVSSGATNSCNTSSTSSTKRGKVAITYTDLLAGYHMQMGRLTTKTFLGASMISHDGGALDRHNKLNGREIGITGALEFWFNIDDNSWT